MVQKPPKSETIPIMIRVPQSVADEIDTYVKENKAADRAGFCKDALYWYLNEQEFEKRLHCLVKNEILSLSKNDPEVVNAIRDTTVDGVIARLQGDSNRKSSDRTFQ